MTTLGQQILDRLAALERTVTDIQLETTPGPTNVPEKMESLGKELRDEIATLRTQIESNPTGEGGFRYGSRGLFSPKDCLPGILSADYKQKWRVWAYKARTGYPNWIRP